MEEWFGYTGKILRVDLTKKKIVIDDLKREWAKLYIGGLGFAARLMWDEQEPKIDPLSPENLLIATAGPMSGTLAPGSGNIFWAFKSPQTYFWGETRSGGRFGPFLKFSGFDMIVIKGKSDEPLYLYLEGGKAELRKASHLWGLTVHQTSDILKREIGAKDISVATIGPAGENLIKYASIMNDYDRAAGRSGGGAVMGSKKLKAIVAAGGYGVKVYDPEKFLSLSYEAEEAIISDPGNRAMGAHGTVGGLMGLNAMGGLPTQNFRTGYFDKAYKISSDYLENNYMIKRRACYSCTIGCSRYSYVAAGKYATPPSEGPEYETTDMSGAMPMIGDMEVVIRYNYLANNYGIDTITLGHTISWAIEAYEMGLITDKDTGGLKLKWGDPDTFLALVDMIVYRKGFGDLLAEGSYWAAKKIGRGTEDLVNHVKGLEFPAHDPRVESKFLAIQYAVGPRGACHEHPIYPSYDMMGVDAGLREVGLPWPLPDRLEEIGVNRGKAYRVIALYGEVINSLGYCNFYAATKESGSLSPKRLAALYSSLTGIELTPLQIFEAGERSWNLKRAFNLREGLEKSHDTLPKRMVTPILSGPAKGLKVEKPKELIEEAYEGFGWDKETGYIKEETLRRLGLDDVADYLKKINKLR